MRERWNFNMLTICWSDAYVEGSGPGVHLYAHPENRCQERRRRRAAGTLLDGGIFPSPAPIISVFIKIHKIW